MKRVASTCAVTLCVSLSAPTTVFASETELGQDGGSVILVLDGSGSMDEPAGGGQTRMGAAKEGLSQVVDALPAESSVGLRVYGSEISDGPGSCEDSELLVPVDKVDKDALNAGIDELTPLGNTPIAYSLQEAAKDLPSEGPRSVVLVSDGEENCGGDPCEVARSLKDEGADLVVDVVGLQVDDASRNQLTYIASAGGGTYYEVDKIDELPSTLERASVRGARGYEPAGIPVEGGTEAGNAPEIDDGGWLDTIGDSGIEHYEVPDPGDGTLHVSASTRTTSPGLSDTESLEVALMSADGTECGDSVLATVQGSVNQKAPYSASLIATADDREDCGDGPYIATVSPPEVSEIKPLEVLIRTEPAIESKNRLPAAFEASGYSDETTIDDPSTAEPVSAIGSPSFGGAPAVGPGQYTDSILPGETLIYRVSEVGWGQQPVCDFSLGSTAVAGAALRDDGYFQVATARVYGPMKSELTDASTTENRVQYWGDEEAIVHVAAPDVRYLNRESSNERMRAAALDGGYYCALTLFTSTESVDEAAGEIPVALTVGVNGEAGEGEPPYVEEPTEPRSAGEDAESGSSLALVAGVLVGLLALLALAWALVRRRRRST